MSAHTVIPQVQLHHRLGISLEWAKVTPDEMASELGMHVNSVHNYIAGRRTPKRPTLIVWSMRCGVPYEWLESGAITEGDTSEYRRPWDVELPFQVEHDDLALVA